jgi:hypothetical protein
MKKVAAMAAAGSLVGLFGVNLAGSVGAHAESADCPDNSPRSTHHQGEDPPWTGPTWSSDSTTGGPIGGPNGWTVYSSWDPTTGAPSGQTYAGFSNYGDGNPSGLGGGRFEAGGDLSDGSGAYFDGGPSNEEPTGVIGCPGFTG